MNDLKHVTILTPMKTSNSERKRYAMGQTSPNKKHVVSIRLSVDEHEIIMKAADAVNVSVSEYIRWVSYFSAMEINNASNTPTTAETEGYS